MKAYSSRPDLNLFCLQGCLPCITCNNELVYDRYRMDYLGNRAGYSVVALVYAVEPSSTRFPHGTSTGDIWLYYSGRVTYKRLRQHESL